MTETTKPQTLADILNNIARSECAIAVLVNLRKKPGWNDAGWRIINDEITSNAVSLAELMTRRDYVLDSCCEEEAFEQYLVAGVGVPPAPGNVIPLRGPHGTRGEG